MISNLINLVVMPHVLQPVNAERQITISSEVCGDGRWKKGGKSTRRDNGIIKLNRLLKDHFRLAHLKSYIDKAGLNSKVGSLSQPLQSNHGNQETWQF